MKKNLQTTTLLLYFFLFGIINFNYAETPQIPELDGLTSLLENTRQEFQLPGMAVAVIKEGKVIYQKGFGYRDVDQKKPVTPETLFCIGSCTKAFTGLALAQLIQERKFSLSTPVIDLLPGFRVKDAHDTAQMTVLDLLTHRCGLPDHEMAWYGANRGSDELLNALHHLPPVSRLREAYHYNNLMYMVAGNIASRMDKTPYPELINRRIFTPLGMTHTHFSLDKAQKSGNISLPYSKRGNKIKPIDYVLLGNVAPAGGIISNLEDMSRWVLAQLGQGTIGDKKLLSPWAVGYTQTPFMIKSSEPGKAVLYGLGWELSDYRGHDIISHGGGISGFISLVEFCPKKKFGLIVLTNSDHSWPVRHLAANVIKDRLLGLKDFDWTAYYKNMLKGYNDYLTNHHKKLLENKVKDTRPTAPLEEYAGTYHHPGYGDFVITLNDGKLEGKLNYFRSPLKHYHYDQFLFTNIPGAAIPEFILHFHIANNGKINSLSATIQRGVEPITFKKI